MSAPEQRLHPVSLWLPVIAYMGVIFYVSSLSYPPSPPNVNDKVLHGLEYMGLGVLVARAIAGGLPRRVTLATGAAAVALTVLYGASDEVHQMFVFARTADVRDLLADGVGATAGTIACAAWGIITGSRVTPT